jgi:hypothetical protein
METPDPVAARVGPKTGKLDAFTGGSRDVMAERDMRTPWRQRAAQRFNAGVNAALLIVPVLGQ